jgi:hypothetical protein
MLLGERRIFKVMIKMNGNLNLFLRSLLEIVTTDPFVI